MSLRGKRVLVDCANGAAYHVAPPVFHELGAEVIPFCDKPDGFNINVNCGVMEPAAAAQKTAACGANVGVILDGDADRVFLADETGTIHNGDALLYLIAQAEHQRGNTLQGVAGTIMSNLALEQALATMGTDFYRADVGDRRVLQALVKNDWPLGGETSGHIVLRWLHSTGDGIIAALQVLAIMCETGKPLSELLANFHPLPQCSRNVKVADKRKALENNVVQQALSEVETRLRGHGRIVVRPSGTEEFVRIMVEAENKTFAQAAADEIYAALTAV